MKFANKLHPDTFRDAYVMESWQKDRVQGMRPTDSAMLDQQHGSESWDFSVFQDLHPRNRMSGG